MSSPLDRLTAALADRYRIERELGQGGMAIVYLAEDVKHKRKVALKVLKPELAAVLGADRFVQEIKTTAALQHPHILPLFDSGTADGFLFYVMPFIDGETLRTKLDRETQLGIDEAVRITTEVADALHYAHTQGVIHRDIKPENILLANGRPMVADFGIALAVSAAAGGRMTETGLSLGTPHYMSPEQATAGKEITARSDIYSLGSVLYEMLTGEPPHMGNSVQAIIMKIVTEDAQPVTRLRILALDNGDAWPTALSPDGRWLLYYGATQGVGTEGDATDPNDLFFLDLSNRESRRVRISVAQRGARFSPDGRWVAYQSTESGEENAFVRPWPAMDARYQVSTGGGVEPIWSRDGRAPPRVGRPNRRQALPRCPSGVAKWSRFRHLVDGVPCLPVDEFLVGLRPGLGVGDAR